MQRSIMPQHLNNLRTRFSLALAIIPIAGFLAIPPRTPASPDQPAPARTISAVSLNLAKETDADKVVRAIHDAPRLRNADIFLLQEVVNEELKSNVAEVTARKLGYFASFAAAAPGVNDQGLALLSRYPISDVRIRRLKPYDLGFHSRNRFAIAATVRTPFGNVRVWNAHLDTRINAEERRDQLQPVIDETSQISGPRLIGGDFNTNELYWLGNIVPLPGGASHRSAIRGAMRLHGFEAPFSDDLNTYPMFRRHLDWIFVSDLQPLATSVEPVDFSDHNAIWIRLSL
jgi:endonuclease/exonuclease/phosphatase family metal-dependent hydrolase